MNMLKYFIILLVVTCSGCSKKYSHTDITQIMASLDSLAAISHEDHANYSHSINEVISRLCNKIIDDPIFLVYYPINDPQLLNNLINTRSFFLNNEQKIALNLFHISVLTKLSEQQPKNRVIANTLIEKISIIEKDSKLSNKFKGAVLAKKGEALFANHQTQRYDFYNDAIIYFRKDGYHKGVFVSDILIGNWMLENKYYSEALEHLLRGYKYTSYRTTPEVYKDIEKLISRAYLAMGAYSKAYSWYSKSHHDTKKDDTYYYKLLYYTRNFKSILAESDTSEVDTTISPITRNTILYYKALVTQEYGDSINAFVYFQRFIKNNITNQEVMLAEVKTIQRNLAAYILTAKYLNKQGRTETAIDSLQSGITVSHAHLHNLNRDYMTLFLSQTKEESIPKLFNFTMLETFCEAYNTLSTFYANSHKYDRAFRTVQPVIFFQDMFLTKNKEVSRHLTTKVQSAMPEDTIEHKVKLYHWLGMVFTLVVLSLFVYYKRFAVYLRIPRIMSKLHSNFKAPQASASNAQTEFIKRQQLFLQLQHEVREEGLFKDLTLTARTLSQIIDAKPGELQDIVFQFTNMPVMQWVNQIRITYFLEHISRNTHRTQDFTKECGFANYTTFYKVFKEHTSMSPKQYIESVLNKL
ncbi:MAG: helix-turn-helix domain-containing protein [Marinifilaceae bacterium]